MIETTIGKMLPIISFALDLRPDSTSINEVDLSTRSCPNYIMVSSNQENIAKFTNSFKTVLRRKNSHYVMFVPRNFSTNTFFEDIPYFMKVEKVAVVVMDVGYSSNSTANQLASYIIKRYLK